MFRDAPGLEDKSLVELSQRLVNLKVPCAPVLPATTLLLQDLDPPCSMQIASDAPCLACCQMLSRFPVQQSTACLSQQLRSWMVAQQPPSVDHEQQVSIARWRSGALTLH